MGSVNRSRAASDSFQDIIWGFSRPNSLQIGFFLIFKESRHILNNQLSVIDL